MKKNNKINKPRLIKGDLHKDERGEVSFINQFKFPNIKRFYIVSNRKSGMVRAWHAHKNEAKYVYALSGEALVATVFVDDWKNPSKTSKVYRFLLSFKKPAILFIPNGYANGFKSLTKDAKLMFFSNKSLGQSRKDDFRFESNYWNIEN